MDISISNIIINYFLLHNDLNQLQYIKLKQLINIIRQKFHVTISDDNEMGLILTKQLFNDFLEIDKNKTIYQNNILDYLQELQPIYAWISIGQWQKQQQYYKTIKDFK